MVMSQATLTPRNRNTSGYPVITVPGAQSVLTNEVLAITGTSISDAENNDQTVDISVSNGTFSLASTTGLSFTVGDGTDDASMTFSGSLTNVNAAIAQLDYTSDLDYVGSDLLAISTDDGNGGTASRSIAITVLALSYANFRRALLNIDPTPDGIIDANDRRAILDLELV